MGSKVGSIRKPDFFIVGAPKCGTESMTAYLRQHPDIFMARKEPHYFGCDIQYNSSQMSEQKYLNFFSEARNEKRVGEKSTWYLYSKRAAAEIKKFCPNAKIIIQVRNPVDMLYSLYNHLVHRAGREDILDFEVALEAEKDRRRGFRIPKYARFPEHLYYSEIPLYTEQIERYLNAFGREQIHIIVFDDLVTNTIEVYRETLRFLEVEDQFSLEFRVYNPSIQRKNILLYNLMRDLWSTRMAKVLLPGAIRRTIGETFSRWNISNKPSLPMDKFVRKRLQEQFAPEVKSLSKLLCRDFTYWCKD